MSNIPGEGVMVNTSGEELPSGQTPLQTTHNNHV